MPALQSPASAIIPWICLLVLGATTGALMCRTSPPAHQMAHAPEVPHLQKQEQPGLPNFHHLTDWLWCGGDPADDDALERLAQLDVKTIVSVDGAPPRVDAAAALGIRYVHLPLGYNGISAERLLELAAAQAQLPRPIYVHCHRGLHRGPAAAVAMLRIAHPEMTASSAEHFMELIGTSRKYPGLYGSAMAACPFPDQLPAIELPALQAVAPLTQEMVAIEHDWDRLEKTLKQATSWSDALRGDTAAFAERFVEAGRLIPKSPLAEALRVDGSWLLAQPEPADLSPAALATAIRSRCDACHQKFRDQP